MKTRSILYIASLLALSACTGDDTSQQPSQERVPVTLSYTTLQAVDTRAAAATGLNDTYLASGQAVMVKIANVGTTSWTDYTYTTGEEGAMTAPTSPQIPLYPTDDTHIKIIAYSPADAGTTFTVAADQTTDADYHASDLMFSNNVTDQAKQVAAVPLTFVHKMSKVVVNATAGTGVSTIVSATLKQVKRQVSFDQSDGTVGAAAASGSTDVAVITGGTESSASGAAVIPAQTIDGTLLEIETNLGTATYTVDSKVFESGHKYTLNITVNRTSVAATTALTGWSGDGSVTIQPSVLQQTFDVDNNAILTFNYKGVQFQMIGVKGGSYTTFGGSTVTGTLTDYYIGQTEVTNALWKAVMGSTPSASGWTDDQQPVQYVSWLDICGGTYSGTTVADEDCFLTKLNAALSEQLPTGKTFKLPSEAQWEYAARGGSRSNGYTYAGSNYLEKVAWWGNTGTTTHSYTNPSSETVYGNSEATTHPVGLLMPNELGLYDMSGNVWEWCQDWYDATITASQGTDYVNTEGSLRVFRGGGWITAAARCAVSLRHYGTPPYRDNYLGLRLVLQ